MVLLFLLPLFSRSPKNGLGELFGVVDGIYGRRGIGGEEDIPF